MNLKRLAQSDVYDDLVELIELQISQLNKESVKMTTEFDTIWNMAEKTGGKRALESIIQNIENAR